MNSKRKVHVIGGGFTGTLAAYLLIKEGFDVVLFDSPPKELNSSSPQLGGMIRTISEKASDRETAANGFISHALLESVADEIGVKLVETSQAAKRNKFLWVSSSTAPERWPLNILETLMMAGRFFVARIRGRHRPQPRETLETWGYRVLGKAATDRLLATAMLGIYASTPSTLSASLILGRFFSKKENKLPKQSRKRRLRGTVAPQGGMGEWFEKMREFLQKSGATIHHQKIEPLESIEVPTWICTSAPSAAKILEKLSPDTSRRLQQIEMVPVLHASMTFPASPSDPEGFGCLFHPGAGFSSLGALYCSSIFPQRTSGSDRTESWIMGGQCAPELLEHEDPKIIDSILADRARLIPNARSVQPLQVSLVRWPQAFPHYSVRLERLLEELPSPHPLITLQGNYLGSLGLAQIALRVHREVEKFVS